MEKTMKVQHHFYNFNYETIISHEFKNTTSKNVCQSIFEFSSLKE